MKVMHVILDLSIKVMPTIKVIIKGQPMDSISTTILIIRIKLVNQLVIKRQVVILTH